MRLNRNKSLIIALALLVAVSAAVGYFAFFSAEKVALTSDSESSVEIQQPDTKVAIDDNEYALLTGDAFDEAYIAGMIAHHEGAVNMAEQARAVTTHEEIRTLSDNIVQSQSQEMVRMTEWQMEWGYEATMGGGHLSHGGGGAGVAGDMVEMINKLKDLTGEAYDKEFLKQMILHHEQAVEMSQYAEQNAEHQEVKDLANEVISAQTEEIAQMKQWQMDWGYDR